MKSPKTMDGIEMILPEKIAIVRKTKDGEMRLGSADLADLIRDIAEDAADEARALVANIPKPDNGKDGLNGKNGRDGKDGINGKDGRDGADGRDGKDGERGSAGIDGKNGRDGINGRDGKDGKNGERGPPGERGPSGGKGGGGYPRLLADGGVDLGATTELRVTGPGVVASRNGSETVLNFAGGGGAAQRFFVQPTQPVASAPYLWVQTGLAPGGNGFTFWFEDGV